jgi:Tfp pilus assembly protein PilX
MTRDLAMRAPDLRDRRGIALMIVLLIALFVSSVAIAAAMLTMNSSLIRRASTQESVLNDAAQAAVEEGRSIINGDKTKYPDDGYNTLVAGGTVLDANGNAVPGLTRSIYVGPTGITSGQYGVFGSVVAVVQDASGNKVVRREEINQESFAKYAYFTNIEGDIVFGGGDQIFGPVHSNDDIEIYNTGAKFWDEVRTGGKIIGAGYGTFVKGYDQYVTKIPLPSTADLTKLKTQAQQGNMAFTSTTSGTAGQATTRIEFVAVDLDGDGSVTGPDEGFIRVYQSTSDPAWVVADRQSTIHNTYNCGDFNSSKHSTYANGFYPAYKHSTSGSHDRDDAMTDATSRCYLGGDPVLTGGFQATTPSPYPSGKWLKWPGTVDPKVTAARPDDAAYLWPITRALNPNFKGVIYVDGKVAISGVVRGRVTLASTSSIIIADDVRQATDPGAGVCDDILGLFAQQDVVVADNMINAPVKVSSSYKTMDPDGDRNEFIHAVVLALDNFTVENYDDGPDNVEKCESTTWGRGCLYLTGGIIQKTRGAVGTTGGTGNVKRYTYNTCAMSEPPPYFPTTGHFVKNRIYELDPTNFDVAAWFAANQPAP